MRRPKHCWSDDTLQLRELLHIGDGKQPFRLTLDSAEKLGPTKGDLVFTTVEISLNGPHLTPYGRFPEVGYYEDHTRLNELGISISWKSANGMWHKRYVQTSERG